MLRGQPFFLGAGPPTRQNTIEALAAPSTVRTFKQTRIHARRSAGFSDSTIASLMLTVPVRALALRVGMVDLPGPRQSASFAPSRFWGAWLCTRRWYWRFIYVQRAARAQIVDLDWRTVVAVWAFSMTEACCTIR